MHDRQPTEPEPLGGDFRTGCNILLVAADALTLPLKVFRMARGWRADTPLVRLIAVAGFPFAVASLGPTNPGVLACAWLTHVAMLCLMPLGRWNAERRHGPVHSRFVGWSFPEVLGLPAGLSKLLLEPLGWALVGWGLVALGERGLGTFYVLAAALLPLELLLIVRRDHVLATDAVDARIEAEARIGDMRGRLGG